MMMSLHKRIQHLVDRRAIFDETEDPDAQDTAYMAVQAAEMDLRAEIRAARQAAGIRTIGLAEAERLRRRILTGGAV